jgi:hypothetical protein
MRRSQSSKTFSKTSAYGLDGEGTKRGRDMKRFKIEPGSIVGSEKTAKVFNDESQF